jgi:hypothetical protein
LIHYDRLLPALVETGDERHMGAPGTRGGNNESRMGFAQ